MKKKTVANLIMVLIILMIAAAGILGVGMIRGWFDSAEDAALVSHVRGIVNLQREGVAYTVTAGTVLRAGDQLTCTPGSTATLRLDEGSYAVIGENAAISVTDASPEQFTLEISGGELFAVSGSLPISAVFDGKTAAVSNAVALLSIRTGAQTVSVFRGAVLDTPAGSSVSWVGTQSPQTETLSIRSLNAFTIYQLRAANKQAATCFGPEALDALEEERFSQMQAQITLPTAPQQTTAETSMETVPPAAETVPAETETYYYHDSDEEEETSPPVPGESTAPSAPTEATTPSAPTEATVPTAPTESTAPAAPTQPQQTQPTSPTEAPAQPTETEPAPTLPEYTCTVTILCNTILDNWDNLRPEKAAFVPGNGVILANAEVRFSEGETVFDVLKRICDDCGIQLEYSWTPMYGSYYIEGINYLYEFDCGPESGWMYKVNGWFPNYGCSSYYLTGDENIVWCYTCNGLGADVGG